LLGGVINTGLGLPFFFVSQTRLISIMLRKNERKKAHFGSDGLVMLEDMLTESFKGDGQEPKMIFGLVVQQNKDVTPFISLNTDLTEPKIKSMNKIQ
jgi:hypothetical protein